MTEWCGLRTCNHEAKDVAMHPQLGEVPVCSRHKRVIEEELTA